MSGIPSALDTNAFQSPVRRRVFLSEMVGEQNSKNDAPLMGVAKDIFNCSSWISGYQFLAIIKPPTRQADRVPRSGGVNRIIKLPKVAGSINQSFDLIPRGENREF